MVNQVGWLLADNAIAESGLVQVTVQPEVAASAIPFAIDHIDVGVLDERGVACSPNLPLTRCSWLGRSEAIGLLMGHADHGHFLTSVA